MKIYNVLYINTDEPELSEIYGGYNTLDKALDKLLNIAGYWKSKDDNVLQNGNKVNKYWKQLKNEVLKNNELIEYDIFRIEICNIE